MPIKLRFDLAQVIKSQESSIPKRKAFTRAIRTEKVKRAFGRQAIDAILKRTSKGIDKRNDGFVGYSSAYKKSREFKRHFKTSTVNLKLTGKMHRDTQIFGTDATGVTIGIKRKFESDKAKWHIRGAGLLPVRDFWGLSEKDQYKILKNVLKGVNTDSTLSALAAAAAAVTAAEAVEDARANGASQFDIDILLAAAAAAEAAQDEEQ